MMEKLLVLGTPGSGKSTAVQHICQLLHQTEWDGCVPVNDYPILLNMARVNPNEVQLLDNGGFEVRVYSAYHEALKRLEQEIKDLEESLPVHCFVTIEFARNDYYTALKQFNSDFLKNAHILFIRADIKTCLERIRKRIAFPKSENDHPSAPEAIFEDFFSNERIEEVEEAQKVAPFCNGVEVIWNTESLDRFYENLDLFVHGVLQKRKVLVPTGQ